MKSSDDRRKNLEELIRQSSHTKRSFALAIGVSDRNVRRWLSGEAEPNFNNAVLMARELGISLEELAVAFGFLDSDQNPSP